MFRGRVHRQFYLAYVSFSICLLLVLVPAYYYTLSLYEKECIQTSEEMLLTGVNGLEADLINLSSAVVELLESNDRFLSLTGSKKPDPSKYVLLSNVHSQFQQAMRFRSLGEDYGLILPSGVILSRQRIYFSGDEMYDAFLSAEGYDAFEEWAAALYRADRQFLPMAEIRSDDIVYRGMTYVFRPTSSAAALSTRAPRFLFYCTFTESHLLRRLILSNVAEDCSLRIYDAGGTLLGGIGAVNRPTATICCEGGAHLLRVEMDLSRGPLERRLAGFRTVLFISLAAFIAAALLLALGYARGSARPLRTLSTRAANASESLPSGDAARDEISYIARFIDHADSAMRNYRSAIEHQNDLLRTLMIRQLVGAARPNEGTLRHMTELFYPDFPARYALLMVKPPYSEEEPEKYTAQQLQIQSLLEEALPPHTLLQPVSYSGTLLSVLPLNPDDDILVFSESLSRAHALLQEKLRCSCLFAVSQPCAGVDALPGAYDRLHAMIRKFNGIDCSVLYDEPETAPPDGADAIAGRISDRFYQAIARGLVDEARPMLEETLHALRTVPGVNEQIVACAFHAYACQLLRARTDLAYAGMHAIDVPAYDARQPLDVLWARLTDSAVSMCALMLTHQEQARSSKEQDIIAYINQHLSDPQLCSQMVTDYFGLTEYALQRIIRQATGRSFFEHLDYLRMSQARRLVLEGAMPISDILLACGYTSRNTFYKAFKRSFGMSPSELRAQTDRPSE